mmetsp:Transcript_35829/g.47438  ORF Transcript_35829/g.47438 Transcript_35829/m.47438 type:complete len:431 (+) Transcript_35829:273-1565(+)
MNGDLTVMVIAVLQPSLSCTSRNDTVGPVRGFLRVWDGTGPPQSDPLPPSFIEKDPPSEALISIANILQGNPTKSSTHPTNTTTPFQNPTTHSTTNTSNNEMDIPPPPPPKSLCGRIINVAIWEKPHWDLVREKDSFIRVGYPIRLRNVSDGRLPCGLRCLMVRSKSSMTPLPERTFEVISLLKDHHRRIVRGDPYNPQSGVLPLHMDTATATTNTLPEEEDEEKELDHSCNNEDEDESCPSSPINEVELSNKNKKDTRHPTCYSIHKTHSTLAECLSGDVPASFVSSFKIDRTYPVVNVKSSSSSSDDDDNENLKALCVQDEADGKLQFQFAFHLNDGTTELDAIVSNDVAETLLGVTAIDVCADSYHNHCGDTSSTKATVAKRNKLSHEALGKQKLSKILDSTSHGKIRSVCIDNSKYFILDDLFIDE